MKVAMALKLSYRQMKFLMLCITGLACVCLSEAQIDSRKQSGTIIPAVEVPETPNNSVKIAPERPETNTLAAPRVVGELKLPEKEFSMFPQEEFANPGVLYTKRLKKIEKSLLPEGHGSNVGLKEDAYWGDYHTNSKYVTILYRDYSAIDGDLLSVLVDDNVLRSRQYLTEGYKGFRLDLSTGLNKIEFLAINTGASGPNTAEYKVLDDRNNVISKRVWALEAGVKVTMILVKD